MTAIDIAAGIALLFIAYRIGSLRGYTKGHSEGHELARGWRDETIEKYKTMVEEAIRQRDHYRDTRVVVRPNHVALKDLN